eukprot:11953313-Alexandrium_andersonii.AAC.1
MAAPPSFSSLRPPSAAASGSPARCVRRLRPRRRRPRELHVEEHPVLALDEGLIQSDARRLRAEGHG